MRRVKRTRHCRACLYLQYGLCIFLTWMNWCFSMQYLQSGRAENHSKPDVWMRLYLGGKGQSYTEISCVSRPQVQMQLQRLCCYLYVFPFLVWDNFSPLLFKLYCWWQHSSELLILNLVHTPKSVRKGSVLPRPFCSSFSPALEYELVHVPMWIAHVLRASGILSETVKPLQTSYSHN